MNKNYSQLNLGENTFSNQKKTSRKVGKLNIIKNFINWENLANKIALIIDKTNEGKGGRKPIPIEWMLRILFLQNLYNLSDPEMEDELIDSISFQKFVGIHLDVEIPDFSTIWRFRERLIKNNLNEFLFNEIYQQIERRGLIIKKGVMIDATLIQSSGTPLSNVKRKELEQSPSNQIDTDATSTKKRDKYYFGYKGHIGVDIGSKIIKKRRYTTAAVDDREEFITLQTGVEKSVMADSGYASKNLKKVYRMLGVFWYVMDRAYKNTPLSNKQKKRNNKIAKVRSGVEHIFAYIKDKLGYIKASYKNIKRNEFKFDICCILYNINRTHFLLSKQV